MLNEKDYLYMFTVAHNLIYTQLNWLTFQFKQ